ncbi:MAG: polysaccharide pyruvyl transferase family protein [Tyzzerella sp.]|nr:polysaccharide pyruvyl transferase family protein [Tyzzerella sp.]
MKIGILTFFESDNYGTVLQAYALQDYLQSIGHHVTLLHFKRNINATSSYFKEEVKEYTLKQRIKNRIVMEMTAKAREKKKEEFKKFRNEHLNISSVCYETGEDFLKDAEKYDLLISGGDQIWNPYHKSFSLTYMFDFLPEKYPRISYGSSFGIERLEDKTILNDMSVALKKYDSILVRESSGVNIVEQMGLHAQKVLDPVFLNAERWKRFIKKEAPIKGKYGIVYALVDYNEKSNKVIQDYIKKDNLKMVVFPDNRWNCISSYKKKFGLSPIDFLNYIAHSEIVFTNSFHGLAFATLFHKQVVLLEPLSLEANSKRNRLEDLLKLFKIEGTIDYKKTDVILNNQINESQNKLIQAIEKVQK